MGSIQAAVTRDCDDDNFFETTGRKPDQIDVHVGTRVRYRRMIIGMSQEKLGERMNLTFQQIQKYEKGTNRIGASRLYQLSKILDVPIDYFFEDASLPQANLASMNTRSFHEPDQDGYFLDFVNSRDGMELNKAFARIQDPKVKRRLIELVRTLAEDHLSEDETSA
jgi:transcriptional regulator with XRE-family HTH domain